MHAERSLSYRSDGVSILTRSSDRMQHARQSRIIELSTSDGVSILTRSSDRMQHLLRQRRPAAFSSRVSILTRSSDRMQLLRDQLLPVVLPILTRSYTTPFQSSPGRLTGCNRSVDFAPRIISVLFQSSPGRLTGCNGELGVRTSSCFNRSPGRLTGCNLEELPSFQSSPGRLTGCNNAPHPNMYIGSFQSSPAVGCSYRRFNPHPVV